MINHHHKYSAYRQVLGTHSLHTSLRSALLLIFANEPSIRSSIISAGGLPVRFFSSIHSTLQQVLQQSIPSQYMSYPVILLWHIVLIRHCESFTIFSSSSLCILSFQLTLFKLLITTFLVHLICRFQLLANVVTPYFQPKVMLS